MAQQNKIGKTATSVKQGADGSISVRYHATEVVRVDPDGVIHLDTGGWTTNTTKTRMNQTANQFGLGFHVYQENFEWFVRLKDRYIQFERGKLSFDPKTGDMLSFG